MKVLTIAGLLLLASCKLHHTVPAVEEEMVHQPYLYVETGECFGLCPIYSLEFSESILYNAKANITDLGKFVLADKSEAKKIFEIIEALEWQTVDGKLPEGVADMQVVSLKYASAEIDTLNIQFYAEMVPEELSSLYTEIERLRTQGTWISKAEY